MNRRMYSTLAFSLIALPLAGCMPTTSEPEQARLRVTHASPDAPPVDVCADGSELFTGAAFPVTSAYTTVPAGTYNVKIVPADAGCESDGVIEAMLTFDANTDTTVAAVNFLDSIEPIVLADNNANPMMGMARVRFVHASPDAPTVDITLDDGTTLFDDIAFKESADYIEVAAGTYALEVRDDTGETTVLALGDIELMDEAVYTVFAIGSLQDETLDALLARDNE